jgi:hypothetical protein
MINPIQKTGEDRIKWEIPAMSASAISGKPGQQTKLLDRKPLESNKLDISKVVLPVNL